MYNKGSKSRSYRSDSSYSSSKDRHRYSQESSKHYYSKSKRRSKTSNAVGYMEYPWHVAMVTLEKGSGAYGKKIGHYGLFHCSGAVVWHDSHYLYVVTSARCIKGMSDRQRRRLVALSGVLDLKRVQKEFQKVSAFLAVAWHPHPAKTEEDLAVVLLKIDAFKFKPYRIEVKHESRGDYDDSRRKKKKKPHKHRGDKGEYICYEDHKKEDKDYKKRDIHPGPAAVRHTRVAGEHKLAVKETGKTNLNFKLCKFEFFLECDNSTISCVIALKSLWGPLSIYSPS